MRPKRTFYNWVTSRYLLIIRNEENFAEKTTLSFNYAKFILFIAIVFIVFLFLSLYLSKTLLASWFDPRQKEIEINKKIVELSLTVDSLAREVDKKEEFIQSLKKVISEDKSFLEAKDSLGKSTTSSIKNEDLNKIDDIDQELRKEFENVSIQALPALNRRQSDLQSTFFFPPLSGIVASKYNSRIDHYGIDVVAQLNEPVRSVSDGTVTLSSWTQDSGYVLAIQHRNNLISLYKHNSALLKRVGNYVKAGDVVSIVGNTGELTNGPHLHFELWYDGNPVNPEEYVSF